MTDSYPSELREALTRYSDARAAALARARAELKIGEADARALLFIAARPGVRPSEVREHLGITSAGVTALIDRLVERDLVRRDLDDTDRRVSRLSVTVDITREPWSALTRFDDDFDRAIAAEPVARLDDLARVLNGLTGSATGDAP